MSQPSAPSSPEHPQHPGAHPGAYPGPAQGGWSAGPASSWAPGWPPPGPAPQAGPPSGSPARVKAPLLLAAAAGVLAGLVGSGLLVAALFTAGAERIGGSMADRIGSAVEEGIVEGTRVAMEESMDEALGAFPEDLYYPGGPVQAPEQFPAVPPEGLGPDPVLDGYAQECFGGTLQACDDLFYESPPMSDYEEYATTCGGRVKAYSVGTCTELE